jgi:hypothetical protein
MNSVGGRRYWIPPRGAVVHIALGETWAPDHRIKMWCGKELDPKKMTETDEKPLCKRCVRYSTDDD